MKRPALLSCIALLTLFAAPLDAQVQIGTDPNAPFELHAIAQDHDQIRQSFVIPAGVSFFTYVTIAVWIDPTHALQQWTQLYFSFWNNDSGFDALSNVNATQPDWYRFTFAGVPITAGAIFFFALTGDYTLDYYEQCTDLIFDDPPDEACPADAGVFYTQRTTVDAYAFGNADDRSDTSGDVVFRALFHNGDEHTVPEPLTVLLLGTGLAGVGAARRRARRARE